MSSILDDKKVWEKVFPKSNIGPKQTYPPFWIPKVGESLTGQIKKVTTSPKSGKNFYIIATESKDGNDGRMLALPATTTVYSQIGRANEEYNGDVGVGSIVYIKYHGMKRSKKGFEYRNFEVFISSREVAKKIMEEKGIDGWEGEIRDDDVKKQDAATREWEKKRSEDKGDEKKEEGKDDEDADEKQEEPEEDAPSSDDKVQEAQGEIRKMCTAFPRFPVATVEKILKSCGVDMDAETFLSAMDIQVEDGKVLRPEE